MPCTDQITEITPNTCAPTSELLLGHTVPSDIGNMRRKQKEH